MMMKAAEINMQPVGCDAQLVPSGESKYNCSSSSYIGIITTTNKLSQKFLVCDQSLTVGVCDYKSLCFVVMICATLD